MNRQQQRILRQMAQSNIDPKKPFEYVNGQFIQTETLEQDVQSQSQELFVEDKEETSLVQKTADIVSKESVVIDTQEKQQASTDKKLVKKTVNKKKKVLKDV